jgi:hypothetical protein
MFFVMIFELIPYKQNWFTPQSVRPYKCIVSQDFYRFESDYFGSTPSCKADLCRSVYFDVLQVSLTLSYSSECPPAFAVFRPHYFEIVLSKLYLDFLTTFCLSLVVTLASKKHRSSIGLEIRPPNSFTACWALLPSASYSTACRVGCASLPQISGRLGLFFKFEVRQTATLGFTKKCAKGPL